MAKADLSVRKRVRDRSDKLIPDGSALEDLKLLLCLLLAIFQKFLYWLRQILFGIFIRDALIEGKCFEDPIPLIAEELEKDTTASVIVRGIGLLAAYTGHRAMFAVYPALPDGLEVTSEGPDTIHFEYKRKEDMLLVGYIAPKPGKYLLRVSRFGRAALGSPFVLRVEEAPKGYKGNFGASLWYDVPVVPPILSGIVDFVTEKMYLDEQGRLFKLKKDGSISKERYVVKNKNLDEQESSKKISKSDKSTETPPQKINIDEPNLLSSQSEKLFNNDDLLINQSRENLSNISKEYDELKMSISKELNEDLAAFNSFEKGRNDITENQKTPKRNIPQITVTIHDMEEELISEDNQPREDKFLADSESGYVARRSGKLERSGKDDSVSSEPCDGEGQIGALPWGQTRADFSKSVFHHRKSPRAKRKYHPSNIVASLGLSKNNCNLTGIRLLHDIYRAEENHKEEANPNLYNNSLLNNEKDKKKDYRNINKLGQDKDLELNNLDIGRISPKVRNSEQLSVNPSDSSLESKNIETKIYPKLSKKRQIEKKITRSFRTLSLPDFNRILSLSVQGLRKAKSCSDKSFRALSSGSLSSSIKNLFEKEQVYNVNKKNIPEKVKTSRGGTALVRIVHYGSGKEPRVIYSSSKSVHEWKEYWETNEYKKETEVARECSLEIKGIVNKGKELFEATGEEVALKGNLIKSLKLPKNSSQKKSYDLKCEMKVEAKTAFQKAKEIFEGDYSSLKDYQDPRSKRKRSLSERFHIPSLTRDIYAGVTPEHLGVPNRIPAVASMGSMYDISPVHQHFQKSPRKEYSPVWNDPLFADPSFV